ncbi:MAG: pirin family protein [Planctomycetota bacterium]
MISLRRSEDRGHADHGWLDTRHSFSFAGYFAPAFMGFGALRVLNQDRVRPGRGFGSHGHADMEIVSYVLEGVLEHEDSIGNRFQLRPGDVQLMSAGTGVTHREYNASGTETLHFLQMWVEPMRGGTEPRYQQRAFPAEERRGRLQLLVLPDGAEQSLVIGQDARLYAGLLAPGEETFLSPRAGRRAWAHVARGRARVNNAVLENGDGAAIIGERGLAIEGRAEAEILVWELA